MWAPSQLELFRSGCLPGSEYRNPYTRADEHVYTDHNANIYFYANSDANIYLYAHSHPDIHLHADADPYIYLHPY